jgi:hypothetical protein
MKHRLHISDEIEGFLQIPLGRDELRFLELQNTPPIRMWAQVRIDGLWISEGFAL